MELLNRIADQLDKGKADAFAFDGISAVDRVRELLGEERGAAS